MALGPTANGAPADLIYWHDGRLVYPSAGVMFERKQQLSPYSVIEMTRCNTTLILQMSLWKNRWKSMRTVLKSVEKGEWIN